FGIGDLRGQVARLFELELGLGDLARGDVDRVGPVEIESDGARLERVMPWLQSRRRKAEAALPVGDHADSDRRIVLPGADDDSFHGPFLGRTDLAGQTGGALRL